MPGKLDVGATLSRVFELYREQAGIVLPAAALIFLIPGLAAAAVGREAATALVFAVSVIGVIAGFWYQGLVVEAVRDIEEDGKRDYSVGDLFRSAAPFVGALLVTGFLAGLGIALGLIALIVPGLVLLTWWALIAPVIVVERRGIFEAFRRSRELVVGHGWQVFGIIVLLAIVQALVAGVFRGLAVAISDSRVSEAAGNYVGNVIMAPLSAIAATVVYLRLREIKEGRALAGRPGGFAPPRPAGLTARDDAPPSPDPGPGPAGPPSGGSPLPGEEHRGWAPPKAPD